MDGNVSFIEVGTTDPESSRPFFARVFGWPFHAMSGGGGWFQGPSIRLGLHGNDPQGIVFGLHQPPV
jgi:predicted enzyme related to lactoylglutathione lyase